MSQSRGQPGGTPTQRRRPQGNAVPASPPTPPRSQIERITARTLGATAIVSFVIMAALAAIVVLSSLFISPKATALTRYVPTATATQTPVPFDPGTDAPLPNNRLILDYGIYLSQIDHNGPASIYPFTFLPHLQELGKEYTAADPKHPAMLGLDLVVNVADSCQDGVVTLCDHDIQPNQLQAYIDYCQQNNLLLFLDFQFGRANVRDVVTHYLPYLTRYPFVELAIDMEFHFYSSSYGIPSYDVGNVTGEDINWVINQLAAIPVAYHVPRKALILHQFRDGTFIHESVVKPSPLVSVVIHTDGFGPPSEKIDGYTKYVTDSPISPIYGGFKLFTNYASCPMTSPGCSWDLPQWTPTDIVTKLNPAPLIISYE